MASARRPSLARRPAVGLAAAVVASGCAGSGAGAHETFSPPPESPLAVSPTSGPDPVARAEAEVRAAYTRYWETVVRVARDPDPHSPALTRVATGATLQTIKNSFAVDRLKGWVSRGHVDHAISDVAVDLDADPPTATLQDCIDGSGWQLYDKETGRRIPTPEGLLPQTTRFVWRKGRWLVYDTLAGERGHC